MKSLCVSIGLPVYCGNRIREDATSLSFLCPNCLSHRSFSFLLFNDEIQRGVENLRYIKRRFTLQGTLISQPPMPRQPRHSRATGHRTMTEVATPTLTKTPWVPIDPASTSDDPFHLFWVPADMHPEIDPTQFRQLR
ncbi:hypothetical protein EI94DRAFT_1790072, partial [Lactarius quietus]